MSLQYPTSSARRADLVVHLIGLVLAVPGGAALVGLALAQGSPGLLAAVAVYAAGPPLMLAFSLAYNLSGPSRRPVLRRLDHAGIFFMIAASYTPFTTQALSGSWAWGMTAAVWAVAGLGIAGRLLLPGVGRRVWIAVYLALGWLVVVALKPITEAVSAAALILLVAGGVAYSAGVVFHLAERFKFSKAVWHGHVVAAAAAHWGAVLTGVVLAHRA